MARALVSLLVLFVAVGVLYFKPDYNQFVVNTFKQLLKPQKSCLSSNETLFTPEDLKAFDGQDANKGVYLSFLGTVYDVTRGIKHYGPGGTYHIFAGRDATRAFVTGNFEEDYLLDDVTDLEPAAFSGIREWEQFYQRDYKLVGRLVGSYYDSNGCPTEKFKTVHTIYDELDRQVRDKKQEEEKYPPCNSEWSQESQVTRFWCSTMSGGVQRSWTGVPRQLYSPETKNSRCACVQMDEETDEEPAIQYADDPMLKQYPNCPATASECIVSENK